MRPTTTWPAAPAVTLLIVMMLAATAAVHAGVAVLEPSQDNTLYEDPTGSTSNGAGWYLFAGNNANGTPRRGLVAFDVAGALPAGATVEAASLTLNVSNVPLGATPTSASLHRLQADWGEGASDAGIPGGGGVGAAPGDATWLNTFFPTDFWTLAGGDFEPAASADQAIGVTIGPVTWGSTTEMVADVQDWLDNPAGNFGWLVLGDESTVRTARRYDSRENPGSANRPELVVEYSLQQPVVEIPTLTAWGLIAMTVLLLAAGAARLRQRRARAVC